MLEQDIPNGQTIIHNSNELMKKLPYIILACVLGILACSAQSSSVLNTGFAEWGESVHGTRLSIMVSNSIIFTNSELVVFVRMENLSVNTNYMSLSGVENDFVVSLKDESGKEYRLNRARNAAMNTTDVLTPNESREWEIHTRVDRYYPPPGFSPAKENVPPGNYTLCVTRDFRLTRHTIPEPIQANVLKIQVR